MDRKEFEKLRDLPDKKIIGSIKFQQKAQGRPTLVASAKIQNSLGADLRIDISYNPEVGNKTFNVLIENVGQICRLDVDGSPHRPASGSHKHSLQMASCIAGNLGRNVADRPDLAGKTMTDLFREFCAMANIEHVGTFESPDT